jgi:putative component of membrane protein insertase Oxa1/YidC/SpoIIIJ protein YidD
LPARVAVNAITWYQTKLSPKKAFSCAYRIETGDSSCSHKVKQAFIDRGVFFGIYTLFDQASKCRSAAIKLANKNRDSLPADTGKKDNSNHWAVDIAVEICCCFPYYF